MKTFDETARSRVVKYHMYVFVCILYIKDTVPYKPATRFFSKALVKVGDLCISRERKL